MTKMPFAGVTLLILLLTLSATTRAQVPANETFKYMNEGEFGPYINEYDASYRMISVFASPFQLAFYNTTPGAFTLAIRIGLQRAEPNYRFVWEANRGNPVGENATFSLNRAGNLVLAHADGRVAWQSNTANKGVVRFELLSTGNMVLYDKAGKFVWQSFDYHTDTLLVGQSLKLGEKLVSRLSPGENKDGQYSLALEPKGFSLYKGKNLYFSTFQKFGSLQVEDIKNMTLGVAVEQEEINSYDVFLALSGGATLNTGRPAKYNVTLSFLRLGIDGSVKIFTYLEKSRYLAWDLVFSLFNRDSLEGWETECEFPEKCGSLGVCEENQCVACPTEKGLLGWSRSCGSKSARLTSCRPVDFHYYEVNGVDHYLARYNRGSAVKESDCGKKCTSDCKCLGYFYNRDTSRCWIANDLMTLTRANSSHVGFIKTPNK